MMELKQTIPDTSQGKVKETGPKICTMCGLMEGEDDMENTTTRRVKLTSDIVISVSGGVINGIFGPDNMTVLLIDFDNLEEGDTNLQVTFMDGTTTSKDCLQTIDEAIKLIISTIDTNKDIEKCRDLTLILQQAKTYMETNDIHSRYSNTYKEISRILFEFEERDSVNANSQ